MTDGRRQVEAFFAKMVEDTALRDKVASIKGDENEVYTRMAAVAGEAGFDVTVDDLRASRSAFGEGAELDDDELDKVSAGCASVCTEVCGMFLGHYIGRQ